MTSFSRGLKISGRVQKRGKVEKVTGSQDDDFVEGTEKHLVGYKNAKGPKKSQALWMTKRGAVRPFAFAC